MPTRNFYVAVSNRFRNHEALLKKLLWIEGTGGFVLLLILSRFFDPGIVVGFGVKIWFSLTLLIAIMYLSVIWFNPDRDKDGFTVKGSGYVLVLDAWLLMILWTWFYLG